MKLYLSSYRIPTPDDLAKLLGKPLAGASVALIPNAQDYYSGRARALKISGLVKDFEALGLQVDTIDLRDYHRADELKKALAGHDLVWAMGGNTFCLRYEMRRSGFDTAIYDLLSNEVVYGGDSAGALVAGISIAGIESADEPAYAEAVIEEGLRLMPYVVLPHTDNPSFAEAVRTVREARRDSNDLIELTDSQAVLFDAGKHWITEPPDAQAPKATVGSTSTGKPRFIFMHGNGTTHWSNGWPAWLKAELDRAGYETFFETMPDSIIARAEYWLPFLKDHVRAGENDVLIGWSSGAVAAMRYAESNQVKGSVLISPCYTNLGDELEKQSGYYDRPWQWTNIKANQGKIALIWGNDDPYIPQAEFEFIAGQLEPKRIKVPGGKHFVERTAFPELLAYISETYGAVKP